MHDSQRAPGRFAPWLIVVLVVAVAVVLTVIVGNILKIFVDEDTLARLKNGKEETPPPQVETYLPDLQAIPFRLGTDDPAALDAGQTVSVLLNDPAGKLRYTSPVGDYLNVERDTDVLLSDTLIPLTLKASYVSGAFHSAALSVNNSDLRFAAGTRESALMREFIRLGGNEILILDLPLSVDLLPAILNYLETVKTAIGSAPLGVAVTLPIACSDDGWEIIGKLLTVCDFCALDAREVGNTADADTLLAQADYALTEYDMRLLLASDQTSPIEKTIAAGIPDYEILTAEEKPIPEPPEEETTGEEETGQPEPVQ